MQLSWFKNTGTTASVQSDWCRAKNYWYKYKLLKAHKCQLGRHNVCRHCVKTVRIRSYSGPYFPAFGLNTDRSGLSLRIQSECSKNKDQVNFEYGHFSCSESLQRKLSGSHLFIAKNNYLH